MKPRSAKNKGRQGQNEVRDLLIKTLGLNPDNIKTAIMGEQGADLKLFGDEKQLFPFDIEVKRLEAINIYAALEQADHHGDQEPIVFHRKNRTEWQITMNAEAFLNIYRIAMQKYFNNGDQ